MKGDMRMVFAAALLAACAARGAHEIRIEGIVTTADEGLLLGNGDLSVSAYQYSDGVMFRFGKGDVWDRRLDFTGAPKPGNVEELIDGVINEGWKADGWNARNLVATKGSKDEKRMREIVRTSPVLGNGPYPTPKPVGELRMKLPVDLAGPMAFDQRVVVEEGRLVFSAAWKCGIRVDAEAVVDPEENVFSLKWKCTGWNDDTHRCDLPPCYFILTRHADPDVNEWAHRRSLDYPRWASIMDYPGKDVKPLPPPEVHTRSGEWAIEQAFYPDNLFKDGFRCRMTLHADRKWGEPHSHPRRQVMKDACVTYVGTRHVTEGEVAVTVTTSRDRTLDAARARPHAEYAARAARAGAAYWAKSVFAMPSDRELENLWYATYHARRCILRGGTVPPGLFFPSSIDDFSRWNGDYHANYNMHSIYWGDFTANRLDQADAWCDMIDFFVPLGRKIANDYYNGRGVFIQLEGFPLLADDDYHGCLPLGRMTYMTGWAMTRHWQYYQFTRDREWLAKRGYPFIRDCALFYLDYLKKAPTSEEYAKNGPAKNLPPALKDGKYHAFPSIQGESGFSGDPMDLCDKPQVLMHVRHALWAAVEAAKTLGVDDGLQRDWQDRLDNLAGSRRDFNSPYEKFCYYCYPPEHGGNGTAYRPPAKEWPPKKKLPRGRMEHQYYGHTIRDRIAAVRHSRFIPARDWDDYRRDIMDWVHPNGLVWAMAVQRWARPGGWTETLSCMAPYQDMLMQSWDGAIRLFPCWPMEKDVTFANWRAQGAFLVSAELVGGRVLPVKIFSEKGEQCLVWGDWKVVDAQGAVVPTDRDAYGRLRFKTVAGGIYRLSDPTGPIPSRERYFGLHFDFHASPKNCGDRTIGATLKAADIEWICREFTPDFIQVDCKGHPGWASYPTKLGNAMPKIADDPLKLWREITKANGVGLYVHYSGVVDEKYLAEHPDEATKGVDGKPNGWFSTRTNGDYADRLLIPQLKELAGVYGVDGAWVDGECWGASEDFDPRTVAQFEKETGIRLGGNLPDIRGKPYFNEYRDFCRGLFKRYLNHYVDTVHAEYPNFRIASNWAFTDHMPEKVSAKVDFLSGDVDPDLSFSSARYAARAVARQGMPWDLMSWNFRWSKFYTPGYNAPKRPVQILQEAAAIISLGGGYQNYVKQLPDGSPDLRQLRPLKALADFLHPRKRWCFGGTSEKQVGVLLSTFDRNRESAGLYHRTGCAKIKGLVDLLCDSGHSTAIVSEFNLEKDIDSWPVLVVPELFDGIEEKTAEALFGYVERGGSLVLAGARPCAVMSAAGAPFKTTAVKRVDKWCGFSQDGETFGCVTGAVALVAAEGETLARYAASPSTDTGTEKMAVLIRRGKGRILAVGADLGTSYREAQQSLLRDFIRTSLARLYVPRVALRCATGLAEINALVKDERLLVQLVNGNGRHTAMNALADDVLPPLLDLELAIRTTQRPKAVRFQPEGHSLVYEWQDGITTVRVPRVNIHAVIELEEP